MKPDNIKPVDVVIPDDSKVVPVEEIIPVEKIQSTPVEEIIPEVVPVEEVIPEVVPVIEPVEIVQEQEVKPNPSSLPEEKVFFEKGKILNFNKKKVGKDGYRTIPESGKLVRSITLEDGSSYDVSDEEYLADILNTNI